MVVQVWLETDRNISPIGCPRPDNVGCFWLNMVFEQAPSTVSRSRSDQSHMGIAIDRCHSRRFGSPILFAVLNDAQSINPQVLTSQSPGNHNCLAKSQRQVRYRDALTMGTYVVYVCHNRNHTTPAIAQTDIATSFVGFGLVEVDYVLIVEHVNNSCRKTGHRDLAAHMSIFATSEPLSHLRQTLRTVRVINKGCSNPKHVLML